MTTITTKYPFTGSIESRIGGRQENQDNAGFVDTPLGLLLIVCDGMGGGPGGKTASRIAVETILHLLEDVTENTNRADALRFAIEKANDIMFAKAQDTPELRGMGSTVTAVIVNEKSAVMAHVGDSRIYQLRKGKIIFRTADHSAVADLVRKGRLTEEQARNHPQSNIVTRALGIRPIVETEIDEVAFRRGDRFVLCSDGIWGSMPQGKLIEALSRPMGIEQLSELVAKEIDDIGFQNGGGHDNLTLAILDTPFDSERNRLKKKFLALQLYLSRFKCMKFTKYWYFILMMLLTILVGVAVSLFVSSGEEQDTPKQKAVNDNLKNKEELLASSISNTAVLSLPETPIDTVLPNFNQQLQASIDSICNSLENLKYLKKKARKDSINSIVKKLDFLSETLLKEKKDQIKQIQKLFDSSKIFQVDKKRELPTKESNDSINAIRDRIKALV